MRDGGDYKSSAPRFAIAGIEFECWATDSGQRFEWRSADGALRAGRNTGCSACWARRDGTMIGSRYPSLRAAMEAVTERR